MNRRAFLLGCSAAVPVALSPRPAGPTAMVKPGASDWVADVLDRRLGFATIDDDGACTAEEADRFWEAFDRHHGLTW